MHRGPAAALPWNFTVASGAIAAAVAANINATNNRPLPMNTVDMN